MENRRQKRKAGYLSETQTKRGRFLAENCHVELYDLKSTGDDNIPLDFTSKRGNELNEVQEEEDYEDNVYQLSELELKRQENMKKNLELFQQFEIDSVKKEIVASYEKPKRNIKLVGLKKENAKKKEEVPRRKSLRIRKLEAEVKDEIVLPTPTSNYHHYSERKPEIIEMVEDVDDENNKRALEKVLQGWRIDERQLGDILKDTDIKNYSNLISPLVVNHCAKVTKNRIYSIAVHPTTNKTIAAFGDKLGHIGIWGVGSCLECNGYPASEEVFLFQPHSSPINCLKFSPADFNKLYSCSYDGTIRKGDFKEQKFSQIFSFDDEDIKCYYFASPCNKPNVLLVAASDGSISLIDTCSGKQEQSSKLFSKAAKCVDCHPINENLFVAASFEGICETWDLRMLQKPNKPLCSFRSQRSAVTAFFSPTRGNKILYTALDNYVRVFDVNKNGEFPVRPKWQKRHDNYTGRWLTSFRAMWNPSTENSFVVGSMNRPRTVDIFNCMENGEMEQYNLYDDNFTSITSLNVFHPTRNILVCGNSSGKAFVWS